MNEMNQPEPEPEPAPSAPASPTPRPAPLPSDGDFKIDLDPATGPAFVGGVIEAMFTAESRAWGLGDGKTFSPHELGSTDEAAHAKGMEYACVRMLDEGNKALEMRNEKVVTRAPDGRRN